MGGLGIAYHWQDFPPRKFTELRFVRSFATRTKLEDVGTLANQTGQLSIKLRHVTSHISFFLGGG